MPCAIALVPGQSADLSSCSSVCEKADEPRGVRQLQRCSVAPWFGQLEVPLLGCRQDVVCLLTNKVKHVFLAIPAGRARDAVCVRVCRGSNSAQSCQAAVRI